MKRLYPVLLAVFILAFTMTAKAETEPNNTYQKANNLAPNGSDGGSLTTNTDILDWWKITVVTDGSLTVTTTAAVGQISLAFYDANGTFYLTGNDFPPVSSSVEATHIYNLAPGTYYVEVNNYSGATGSYTIVSTFTAAGLTNDPFDDDTVGVAIAMGLNTSSSGHLGYYTGFITGGNYTDRSDWWKYTTTQDGQLIVRTTSDATLEVDLEMYDINKVTQIAVYDTSYGIHEATHHYHLMPGTYYVHAYIPGTGLSYGAYSITSIFNAAALSPDPAGNDLYTGATPIAVPASSEGHIGYYTGGYNDIDDWWSVSVPADGKLIVNTLSDATGDIDLSMYDVDGTTQIATYDTSYGIHEATHFALMPGTYYIDAHRAGASGGYSPYTISTLLILPTYANDAESNDATGGAVLLPYADSLTGHLGYYTALHTDVTDWYYVTIPAGLDSFLVETFSDNTLDVDISLFTSSDFLNSIGSGSNTGTYDRAKLILPAAGTYYVKISRRSDYGGYGIRNRGYAFTSVRELSASVLSLHPNPAANQITVSVDDELLGGKVEITDMPGHQIQTSNIEHRTSDIDLSNLAPGIYFVLFKQNGVVAASRKVVKQ